MQDNCKFYLGPQDNKSDDTIRKILNSSKRIAIVGLSTDESKDSNMVARFLLQKNYEIIPVNPFHSHILDLPSYPSIDLVPGDINLVVVFRRPDMLMPIIEQTIDKKVPVVWMQLQVVNENAYLHAEENGIMAIMNRCIKIEYERLIENQ